MGNAYRIKRTKLDLFVVVERISVGSHAYTPKDEAGQIRLVSEL